MPKLPDEYISRKTEILAQFKQVLENHMDDLMAGRIEKMYEIKEIADMTFQILPNSSKSFRAQHHHCTENPFSIFLNKQLVEISTKK